MRTDPSRSAHPDWIVVEDPEREFAEGAVVPSMINRQLEARGACTIPVSLSILKRGGIAGYMRRGFGAGAYLTDQPKMLSAFAMFSTKGAWIVHWRARLVPTPEAKTRILAGDHFDGSLRMIADSGQGGHIAGVAAGASAVMARSLGPMDQRGGWHIGGEAPTHFAIDGFYGLALYGSLAGVRVTWGAVSVTER